MGRQREKRESEVAKSKKRLNPADSKKWLDKEMEKNKENDGIVLWTNRRYRKHIQIPILFLLFFWYKTLQAGEGRVKSV